MKYLVFNETHNGTVITNFAKFSTIEEATAAYNNPNYPTPKKIFDESEVPSDSEIWAWNGNDSDLVADRPQIDLVGYKNKQKAQLKINRDAANLRDYIVQADELILQEDESFNVGSQVDFIFGAKPTDNPATEPNNITTSVALNSILNPLYYLAYSCKIISSWVQNNGVNTNVPNTFRKGYVKINSSVASAIVSHATQRNTNNIRIANQKEDLIDAATTKAEIDAIDITF